MNVIAREPTLRFAKLSPNVGVEVSGIDLRQPVSAAIRKQLIDAVDENIALCIRGQQFTPAEYLGAISLFGEVMEDQNRRYLAEGVPLVSVLSNRFKNSQGGQAKTAQSSSWHTDHTNQARPPKYTSLYPVALPDRGGGTSLCNARAAYAALPAELKKKLDGMKTVNQLAGSARKAVNPDTLEDQKNYEFQPEVHPLVRTHPVNGSKAVWFHPNKTENIVGMSPEETQEFLRDLTHTHLVKPEFTYVHEWKLGDMLVWDNRSALHKAGFDYDPNQHRMLYRTLVRGDKPF